MSPYEGIIIPFTEEELRQSEEDPVEFTLAQILAELEAKEQGSKDIP